jgi:iron(III) transport system permease protein
VVSNGQGIWFVMMKNITGFFNTNLWLPLRFVRGRISSYSKKSLLVGVTFVIIYLVLPPIAIVIFSSVRNTEDRLPFEATNFTLDNFVRVFSSQHTLELLLNTGCYAIGSVILALVMATAFAWFLERTNMPLRRLLFVFILMPLGMPGIILGMAWILLANPTNGLFNLVLRALFGLDGPGPLEIYSLSGMILVTSMRFIPMMYIMISGVFSRIDPSFEEAGSTSGGGPWAVFQHISVPLLSPAIVAAAIYFLVMSIEVFETAALLGMPKDIFVFSTMIYYTVHPPGGLPDYGLAGTYGVLLLATAAGLIYFYSRHVRYSERFATVTGRGYRPRLIDLGRWKFVPVVIILIYFGLAVGMPFLILVWTSLAPRFTSVSASVLPLLKLNAYGKMLSYSTLLTAAMNTLEIASATAFIAMMLVTLASWLSVRGGIRGAWFAEHLSFLVLGVPGVVLALALIFFYAALPVPFYGTIWIIVIALVTISLPFGTRLMNAAFLQIHRELEEAAEMSGAGMWSIFWRIILPLLWPSFARGFLLFFVRSLRDTTIALMLFSAGNQTLAVTLWYLWTEDADFPLASAIAVPMLLVSSILTYFVASKTMLQEGGY